MRETFGLMERVLEEHRPEPRAKEAGTVTYVGQGVARVQDLLGVGSEELVRFEGGQLGLAFNVDMLGVGVILLDEWTGLKAGSPVQRTGRVLSVPVGEGLLGRVVDAMGRPLDQRGFIPALETRPVERRAPGVMDRAPVTVPLQTGIKVIDALIPIGRGQRELILGDRQTGKTAIAVDTLLNQKDKDVLGVYCAIGQRASAVAKVIDDLRKYGVMSSCIVMVATGEDPAGLQFAAPYAATTMAEYFMETGRDAVVVFDDLTQHSRAYRELSLLLRRPPGREAFPGDIFYIHSRLLERSTHLRDELGGGSLTALPIIETEAQNLSAYIPTNLISITDGQIYLSPDLFQKGNLPAVDVGKSVSRVGGRTQLPAYRAVAGDLRLSYAQFEELEAFSRFGTRLDETTRRTLEHGRRVREVLKQPEYVPIPVAEQVAILVGVNGGVFDDLGVERIAEVEKAVRLAAAEKLADLGGRIQEGAALSEADVTTLLELARKAAQDLVESRRSEVGSQRTDVHRP